MRIAVLLDRHLVVALGLVGLAMLGGCASPPASPECEPLGPLGVAGDPPAAFPGAEGAGAHAQGGRGGDVFHVTSLADSGPGTLREGIEPARGPRTIVFAVAGTIELESDLMIRRPRLTIAGQSAPGSGITLAGRKLGIRQTHDVVVRYLRVRPGDAATVAGVYEPDAISVRAARDVILDHVSASWGTDEVLSVTHGSTRVTVQWSLITEALHEADHHKGNHGYGSLITGDGITFHHNLYAHNRSRNPRPGDGRITFANNVIYNPGDRFGYSGSNHFELDYVANVGIVGPQTSPVLKTLFDGGGAGNRIFQRANRIDLVRDGIPTLEEARWQHFDGLFTPVTEPFAHVPLRIEPAHQAFRRVLARAGASRVRDAVDLRVIADVLTGQGRHLDSPAQVGGWPLLPAAQAAPDADGDGMPDAWERAHCLDPEDPADRNRDSGDGTTALEAYLHERAH